MLTDCHISKFYDKVEEFDTCVELMQGQIQHIEALFALYYKTESEFPVESILPFVTKRMNKSLQCFNDIDQMQNRAVRTNSYKE